MAMDIIVKGNTLLGAPSISGSQLYSLDTLVLIDILEKKKHSVVS